jgi:multiple sugar transport system permease protein
MSRSETLLPYMLVAPALIVLAVAVLYPIGFNLFASLHVWNLMESDAPKAFVGLCTFGEVLGDARSVSRCC